MPKVEETVQSAVETLEESEYIISIHLEGRIRGKKFDAVIKEVNE